MNQENQTEVQVQVNQVEKETPQSPEPEVEKAAQSVSVGALKGKAKTAAAAIRATYSSMVKKWSLLEAVAALSLIVSLGSFGWWTSSTNGRLHRLEAADEDLYKNISHLSQALDQTNAGLAAANGRHEALAATTATQINQILADNKAVQEEVLLLVQSEAHNEEVARLKRLDQEAAEKLLAEKKPTGFSGLLASIKNKFK
jgi:hypothetical protein